MGMKSKTNTKYGLSYLVVRLSLVLAPALLLAATFAPQAASPETKIDANDHTVAPIKTFTLRDLDSHPAKKHARYLEEEVALSNPDPMAAQLSRKFFDIVQLYRLRQGVDDNFTLRVNRTTDGSLLEIVRLDSLRKAMQSLARPNWGEVDRVRQRKTRELVDKYEEQGYPRGDIAVRWGRKNQVLEARKHEEHLIEYEIALAHYFDLSLLATELGTVETFNNDNLVSRVGARGRYQIMPSLLRNYGVHRYELRTRNRKRIRVYEERHPLLTMEVSMMIAKAYTNSVGHEIPGLSAYHTGPFNILHIFKTYLTDGIDRFNEYSTVPLAYLWGLTDGYPRIRSTSSFRSYSRGYVPAGLGSLLATEHLPIDTTKTLLADQMSIRKGKSLYLSTLINALAKIEDRLDWRLGENESLYERFRLYNPHFSLPEVEGDKVPSSADVRIPSHVKRSQVRFFLPKGAAAILLENSRSVIDPESVRSFDHDTYSKPSPLERTSWDEEYDDLLRDLEFFDFSEEKVERLNTISEQFRMLAKDDPTFFRLSQVALTGVHKQVWNSENFTQFLILVDAARGQIEHPPLPPIRALERLPYNDLDPTPGVPDKVGLDR